MSLGLIVDVGTTNVKVGIVDQGGNIISLRSRPNPPSRPERGAYEHDPGLLLQNIEDLSSSITRPYKDSIAFVALSGYQFGFLPLDVQGNPLTGMMTLLDDRPKSVMERLKGEFPFEEMYRRTGCPPLFTYIFSRLHWLKESKPDIFGRSHRFADLKSFLMLHLTGQFVTEPSIASATQLLDIHKSDWDDEILQWANVERSQLPGIVAGNKIAGELTSQAARSLGLKSGTPVLPGLYDGGAMILGMGGYGHDIAVCNLGTTAMLRGCATKPLLDDPKKMRLQTYALMPGYWVTGGALNNAGITLRWYHDNFEERESYESLIEQAQKISPGSEGLMCLPFLTGERDPRIGDHSSGVFFGIREFHSRPHFTRSILEGVTYALNMVKEAASENGFTPRLLRIGGSGAKSDLWAGILSNVLNIQVQQMYTTEAALIGEGMLGFCALGTYASLDQATESMVKAGKQFDPENEPVEYYKKDYQLFKDLLKDLQRIYQLQNRRIQNT